MNSKMIGRCDNCDQPYCCECSNAELWGSYCSETCEKEKLAEHSEKQKVTKGKR
jgi:hypothetical protein